MEPRIRVQKTGGIWHGTIDGHPEIDVRALTEAIAHRKIVDEAKRLGIAVTEPRKEEGVS